MKMTQKQRAKLAQLTGGLSDYRKRIAALEKKLKDELNELD